MARAVRQPDSYASRRNTRVRIERDVGAKRDDAGELIPQWVTHCERWANVRQLTAREIEYASAVYALATHAVVLRGDAKTVEIDPTMRVVTMPRERILNVYGVDDVEHQGTEIRLFCGESA